MESNQMPFSIIVVLGGIFEAPALKPALLLRPGVQVVLPKGASGGGSGDSSGRDQGEAAIAAEKSDWKWAQEAVKVIFEACRCHLLLLLKLRILDVLVARFSIQPPQILQAWTRAPGDL